MHKSGKAAQGRRRGNTCEAAIVFLCLFLLRIDPQLDSGLGNTGKTKTYSLDQLG